jgi:KipI family sensor histidine kinase inhibitor
VSLRPTPERLGEDGLLLRLDAEGGADAANTAVHRLAAAAAVARPPWLRDVVPAHASLALFLDVQALERVGEPFEVASAWLARLLHDAGSTPEPASRLVEVPVRYGGDDGPDLDAVAAHAGVSPDAVVALHSGRVYRVAMLGFAPGFPYLTGLDPLLAMPRRATPRVRVAAGSVGIGGDQTGIYPRSGPGGWQLLGRTPLRLFDPGHRPPSLLAPGDRVRFVPVAGPGA